MTWEALGALGEIVGAVAVVSTLVYLAAQTRQASQTLSNQISQGLYGEWNRALTAWSATTADAALIQRGLSDFEGLSQPEKLVFHMRMDALAVEHFKHRLMSIAEDDMNGFRSVFAMILDSPGGAQWWSQARDLYGAQKAAIIEDAAARFHGAVKPFSDIPFFAPGP